MTPLLVTTTTSTEDEARKLSDLLVEGRLAACVNIVGPIASCYFWQGEVQKDTEFKLFIKTAEEKWPALQVAVEKHHSYDTPELTAIKVEDMHPKYRAWLVEYLEGGS